MTEPRPSQVLGGLPRSRPHRRSQRRPAVQQIAESASAQATTPEKSTGNAAAPKPNTTTGAAPIATAAPTGRAAATSSAAPAGADPTTAGPARMLPVTPGARATRTDVLGTAVQAAAELAEIGLTVGARTLRNALSRLPHP